MTRILVITPAVHASEFESMVQHIQGFSTNAIQVTHIFLDNGPVSIETYVDDAFTVPDMMRIAITAEKDGYDGILINCMCDPGLYPVRECVSIPVIATAETAMHTAAVLGHKFGWIDVLETSRTMTEDQVARYGVSSKYAGFRAVDIPVLEIEQNLEKTNAALAEAALKLVQKDHADILILGCGALIGLAEAIKTKLGENGVFGIPVIDPLPLAIKYLIALTEAGLHHSKKAYPTPRQKTAPTGYKLPPYNNAKL